MSFTTTVKAELSGLIPEEDHCREAFLKTLLTPYGGTIRDKDIVKPCCKRAFLRAQFLLSGILSDPNVVYNLEIVCDRSELANLTLKTLLSFQINAKISKRKNRYVVYLKDGEQVSDFLSLIGADRSVLELANVRVVKNVRAQVNRKVNCETSNLRKTISAGVRQNRDIRAIEDLIGLPNLPKPLREIAMLRKKYPNASLEELGEKCNPKIGKSGVNHRLRRLSRMAEEGQEK